MIELSILAHPTDLGFLEPTVRHQLRHFRNAQEIDRRVLVIDPFGSRPVDWRRLVDFAERLKNEGHIDDWQQVPWDAPTVSATMQRWYGDATVAPTAARGRPRYQYCWSVDAAQRELVLHLDSDILCWGDTEWLQSAAQGFADHPHVMLQVPMAGAALAARPSDWMRRGKNAPLPWPVGVQFSTTCSSRHVLVDRERVSRALPLPTPTADEHWEQGLAAAMQRDDLCRLTLVTTSSTMWHPHRHNRMHTRLIDALIGAIEHGVYPYRRFGKPWDITTEGWKFAPWLGAIALRQVKRLLPH